MCRAAPSRAGGRISMPSMRPHGAPPSSATCARPATPPAPCCHKPSSRASSNAPVSSISSLPRTSATRRFTMMRRRPRRACWRRRRRWAPRISSAASCSTACRSAPTCRACAPASWRATPSSWSATSSIAPTTAARCRRTSKRRARWLGATKPTSCRTAPAIGRSSMPCCRSWVTSWRCRARPPPSTCGPASGTTTRRSPAAFTPSSTSR